MAAPIRTLEECLVALGRLAEEETRGLLCGIAMLAHACRLAGAFRSLVSVLRSLR